MSALVRALSHATAKPYRTTDLSSDDPIVLDNDGNLAFSENDVENPKNWSLRRRAYITLTTCLLVMNATFASSSPSGCFPSISQEFGVSEVAAGLTITLFLLGYCAGPLMFAPLSEMYGRRWVFYITFAGYWIFNFLCAWAPNFGSLLVGRFLTGTLVSAPLSNGPGVLADLWGPLERGNAMAGFACMLWIGPSVGPIVSGFLQLKKDWRWSFYVLIWLGAATGLMMFTLPETHAPTVLRHKARRIRKAKISGYENVKAPIETGDQTLVQLYKVALTRPWVLLFDPISFLVAIYMSVVYTLLYMLFSIYPIVFQQMRGWNAGVGELPLIGPAIGAVLGGAFVVWDSQRRKKKVDTGKMKISDFEPEDRLILGMVGGVGFAVSMFGFAWSANYNSVHWFVPTLFGTFLGSSLLLIFVGFLNYIVDSYLMYAASAMAANTIARSACGSAAPLFTNQMFKAMGIGGGGSLIGGLAAVLAIIPFSFYKYGKQIREKSKFAPTKESPKKKMNDEEGDPTEYADKDGHKLGDDEREAGNTARARAGSEDTAVDNGGGSGSSEKRQSDRSSPSGDERSQGGNYEASGAKGSGDPEKHDKE